MGPKRNSKAEAGRERKADVAAQKSAKEQALQNAQIEQTWKVGANVKGQMKADEAAAKADAEARKRQEKEALLAQEEAELGSGGKARASLKSSKKGKKTDDLSLLVLAAEKTSRKKKEAELEKKRKEEQAAKERAEKEKKELDPLLQNTNLMLEGAVGREGNIQAMEETLSGLDGALQTLNISVPGGDVKSQKALHLAFEEKMLPIVKAEYPGLRLSQYKEKIFALWKKSPENPQNQIPA